MQIENTQMPQLEKRMKILEAKKESQSKQILKWDIAMRQHLRAYMQSGPADYKISGDS